MENEREINNNNKEEELEEEEEEDILTIKLEERCKYLKEISLKWQKECNDLRDFAELERETFQSSINEMMDDLKEKNEIIQNLNQKVEVLETEKKSSKETEGMILKENSVVLTEVKDPKMNNEIRKLRSLLKSSQIKCQQMKGENDLLKESQKIKQFKNISNNSLTSSSLLESSCKTVLLIDESLIENIFINRN